MFSVARRPRWIAMLILALAVAAGFAALGQWQLARSVASGTVVERDTETVRQLDDLTDPQRPVTVLMVGQRVTTTGSFVEGDYSVLAERINGGVEGFWVVGHFEADQKAGGPAGLAVAIGWAGTADAAASVASGIDLSSVRELAGRYVAPESPETGDVEAGATTEMAPSALVNQWTGFSGRAYAGYVVSNAEVAGLDRIDAPVPTSEVSLNWLNLFYAAEWAVFAVFAVFLWYRLVKDAWEREVEEAADAASAAVERRSADEPLSTRK